MRFLSSLLTALVFCGSVLPAASGETLTIASWNVANLAEGAGIRLRGHLRSEADYDAIRAIVENLDADVIALQEIGSLRGARAILGDGYEVHFESRCYRNETACEADAGDIFTAIAYRRELGGSVSVFQMDGLAVMHRSECPAEAPRRVRGGVGVKLDWHGRRYAIPSLHLKAGCRRNAQHNVADLAEHCATQSAQFGQLARWMAAPEQSGDVLIVAGDFNRQLGSPADRMRRQLLSVAPDLRFEPSGARRCWEDAEIDPEAIRQTAYARFPEIAAGYGRVIPYTPRSHQNVDYFVIRGLAEGAVVSSEQLEMGDAQRLDEPESYLATCEPEVPKQFPGGGVLVFSPAHPSDHCPITLTIRGE